jgi:hypothetical protein
MKSGRSKKKSGARGRFFDLAAGKHRDLSPAGDSLSGKPPQELSG